MQKILFYKNLITKNGTGFTIIEVLVALAIISTLLVISVSNFSQTRLQLSLSRVTAKFAQDLRRTQQLSLAEARYFDGQGVEHPIAGKGIYVDLSSLGNKKYIMYADKVTGNNAYDVSDYLLETIDFSVDEPGIIIKNINNVTSQSDSHNFNPYNNITYITPITSGQSIEFVFAVESDQSKTKTVLVNTAGLIEIK